MFLFSFLLNLFPSPLEDVEFEFGEMNFCFCFRFRFEILLSYVWVVTTEEEKRRMGLERRKKIEMTRARQW